MAWVNVHIVNCRTASIRRSPWIPIRETDITGIRAGPQIGKEQETIKKGSTIEIDPEQVCYDWTDKKFYKVRNPEGWIYEGVVDYGR